MPTRFGASKNGNEAQRELTSAKNKFSQESDGDAASEAVCRQSEPSIDDLITDGLQRFCEALAGLTSQNAADNGNREPFFFFMHQVTYLRDAHGMKATKAFAEIDSRLRQMAKQEGEAVDPWQHYFFIDRYEAALAFKAMWKAVRFPRGFVDPLDAAIQRAKVQPLAALPPDETEQNPLYTRFISIAAWLQVVRGNHNILLPLKILSERLGTSEMTITRLRNAACDAGLLKCLRRSPRAKSRIANEYRFNVGAFDVVKQAAERGSEIAFEQAEHVLERARGKNEA